MKRWAWLRYDELTPADIFAMLQLRQDVFIVEQNCVYPDIDGIDPQAMHLLGWEEDEQGNAALMAYCRLVFPGVKYTEPSIGRVVNSRAARGSGWGQLLMEEALKRTDLLYPDCGNRISAQQYLEHFYQRFGYRTVSDPYLEDDIPHVEMYRDARAGQLADQA